MKRLLLSLALVILMVVIANCVSVKKEGPLEDNQERRAKGNIVMDCFPSKDKAVSDPIGSFANKIALQDTKDVRLVRIVSDVNNDNFIDIAISASSDWGNAGGNWDIYLGNNDGKYRFLARMFFHPLAISIQPIRKGTTRIITYIRHGAYSGNLIEHNLSSAGIERIKGKITKPGDGGVEADQKEHLELFGHLRNEPISEFCALSDYLKNKNCLWKKGYY